jgi:uncharacterized cupin superfamily protein
VPKKSQGRAAVVDQLSSGTIPNTVAWVEIPSDYVVSGNPATREVELGRVGRTSFGLWEQSPGRAAGRGPAEVFVVLSGSCHLHINGAEPILLAQGSICQTASDAYVDWDVTHTLRKLYLVLDDDAPASNAFSHRAFRATDGGGTEDHGLLGEFGGAMFGTCDLRTMDALPAAATTILLITAGACRIHVADERPVHISEGCVVRISGTSAGAVSADEGTGFFITEIVGPGPP